MAVGKMDRYHVGANNRINLCIRGSITWGQLNQLLYLNEDHNENISPAQLLEFVPGRKFPFSGIVTELWQP